jgi:hypothetical protein
VLLARRQSEGADVHQPNRSALRAPSSQRQVPAGPGRDVKPCIRGWINYYSHFYNTQLRPTLKWVDLYVIRWARRKFKRLRRKTKGARDKLKLIETRLMASH